MKADSNVYAQYYKDQKFVMLKFKCVDNAQLLLLYENLRRNVLITQKYNEQKVLYLIILSYKKM